MEMVMHHDRTLYGWEDDQGVMRDGLAALVRHADAQIGEFMGLQAAIADRAEAWNQEHVNQRYKGRLWSGFLALAVLAGLLVSKLQ